jgi:hypothetical protein
MAHTTHSPPGSHGCYTLVEVFGPPCQYAERSADPACEGCRLSGRDDSTAFVDMTATTAQTAVDWARRWGMDG